MALVSDAGTPAVSDPGARAGRSRCARRAIAVDSDSRARARSPPRSPRAASRPTASCSRASCPVKGSERREKLARSPPRPWAIVLFESPHRIAQTLADLHAALGDRDVVIARELTKRFETIARVPLASAVAWVEARRRPPPRRVRARDRGARRRARRAARPARAARDAARRGARSRAPPPSRRRSPAPKKDDSTTSRSSLRQEMNNKGSDRSFASANNGLTPLFGLIIRRNGRFAHDHPPRRLARAPARRRADGFRGGRDGAAVRARDRDAEPEAPGRRRSRRRRRIASASSRRCRRARRSSR